MKNVTAWIQRILLGVLLGLALAGPAAAYTSTNSIQQSVHGTSRNQYLKHAKKAQKKTRKAQKKAMKKMKKRQRSSKT